MSVLIGHARIDENGRSRNGKAGDQTGKELCTRTWYNGAWDFVARPNEKYVAEKIALSCEKACANDLIGYDQSQRNTLREAAKQEKYDLASIIVPCECDCSSLVSVCVECAGIKLPDGNLPTTRTLEGALSRTNRFTIMKTPEYRLQSKYLHRGDILCRKGHHTVIVLSDGVSAESTKPDHLPKEYTYDVKLPLVVRGSRGTAVRRLQLILDTIGFDCGSVDGIYGLKTEEAVKAYQMANGLTPDGECGGKTWENILTK